MNVLIVQVISYFAVFVFSVIIISVMFRGFFWSFIRVKMSGGKLIMVKLRTITKPIYKTGKVDDDGDLIFKKNKKQVRINNLTAEDIYRDMGVFFVEIDAETNCILKPNLEGVEGFDAEKWNSLYLRALYRPTLLDQKTQIMLILCAITLLLLLFSLFFTYQLNKKVELMSLNVNLLKMYMQNNTIAII